MLMEAVLHQHEDRRCNVPTDRKLGMHVFLMYTILLPTHIQQGGITVCPVFLI